MKMSKKMLAALLAVVMLVGAAIGGTIAYLVAGTQEVTNTFTYGDINILLDETITNDNEQNGNEYLLVPGGTYSKDPKVTVKAGSEECYVFVQITEDPATNSGVVEYDVANGWIALTGVDNVYYQVVDVKSATADRVLQILKDNQIKLSEDVTKADVNNLTGHDNILTNSLTFNAYAVQYDYVDDEVAAWAKVGNAVPSLTWTSTGSGSNDTTDQQ